MKKFRCPWCGVELFIPFNKNHKIIDRPQMCNVCKGWYLNCPEKQDKQTRKYTKRYKKLGEYIAGGYKRVGMLSAPVVLIIIFILLFGINKRYNLLLRVNRKTRERMPFPKHCKVKITFLKKPNKNRFFNTSICTADFMESKIKSKFKCVPIAINDIEQVDKKTVTANICFIRENHHSLVFAKEGETFKLLNKNKPFANGEIIEVYDFEKPKK